MTSWLVQNNKNEIKILYLPSAVFIAQVLMEPSEQLKKIFHIEHDFVMNPNWPWQTSWLFTSVAKDLNSGLRNKTR